MPLMTIRAKRLSNAIIRNTITAQEFDDLVSTDGRDIEFADLIARPGQLSAVAASPTAMAVVATSPTAMAAIGSSPTAMAAFYSSPHIVSVPIMTSNSTPAGLCIASSEYSGEPAWKAFDGIVSPVNGASVWGAATGNAGEWIGYQFSQPIRVTRCLFSPNGGGAGHNTTGIEIQGEFGGVWTTVSTATLAAGEPATTTLDFSSAQAATKWRVRSTVAVPSFWWRVTRVDFLGVAA